MNDLKLTLAAVVEKEKKKQREKAFLSPISLLRNTLRPERSKPSALSSCGKVKSKEQRPKEKTMKNRFWSPHIFSTDGQRKAWTLVILSPNSLYIQ